MGSIRHPLYILFVFVFLLSGSVVEAGPKKRNQRTSQLDKDIKARRTDCDAIVMTLGEDCMSSSIARENCILRCISAHCYDETYGSDALEEGEVDTVRGRNFRACARNDIRKKKEEEAKVRDLTTLEGPGDSKPAKQK